MAMNKMVALLVLGLAAVCGWVSYNGNESKAEAADETTDAAETAEANGRPRRLCQRNWKYPVTHRAAADS